MASGCNLWIWLPCIGVVRSITKDVIVLSVRFAAILKRRFS